MLYHDQNHETEKNYQNPVVSYIHEALVPSTAQTFFKELTTQRWNVSKCIVFHFHAPPPSNQS
jgi:hypothetical protein